MIVYEHEHAEFIITDHILAGIIRGPMWAIRSYITSHPDLEGWIDFPYAASYGVVDKGKVFIETYPEFPWMPYREHADPNEEARGRLRPRRQRWACPARAHSGQGGRKFVKRVSRRWKRRQDAAMIREFL